MESIILTPKQAEIAKDKHRFRVVCAGRRGGKTVLAVEEMKGKALAKPSRVVYIAPTYQQARDIAWETLKRELKPIITKINDSRLEIRVRTLKGGESVIVLRGWESIETLRGQAFDFIVIDEVAMMRNFWVNWREVLRPTLTDSQGDALFISTPKGYNHFYDLYNLELKDKTFKNFHFTSYDNSHMPKDELDSARDQMTPDQFAQEYLAEFSKTEGLVYKEFDRKKHLYDEMPQGDFKFIAGIDFGYTNPAAVLHIYFNGEKYYIDDEWYRRRRTETQIAEYVAGEKFQSVYPDPASPSAIEELRNKGVNTREVAKGKDSIISGIQKIRELLINDKLLVNKRCLNLLYEFETYSYEDEKDKVTKENPIKENDHALDALRYVVMATWDVEVPSSRDLLRIQEIERERFNEFV